MHTSRHSKLTRRATVASLLAVIAVAAGVSSPPAAAGAGRWHRMSALRVAAWGLAAVTGADGRIYAFGGYSGTAGWLHTAERYTPATDR